MAIGGDKMRGIAERTGGTDELLRRVADKTKNDIRVAIPGIVQSFNATEQTVTVQPAIRERVVDPSGNMQHAKLPLLLDVPVIFPRAGGFVLTMPVNPGDECLVIFGDMCIDAWWSNGGIQNPIEKRRHDLSDGFAILGPWSQQRTVSNYSTTAAQLRTEDGGTCISISPGEINVAAPKVNVTATDTVSITSSQGITIQGKTRSESW